jgi:hypothetical protein
MHINVQFGAAAQVRGNVRLVFRGSTHGLLAGRAGPKLTRINVAPTPRD